MVLFGDLRFDFRVFREADTLKAAGYEVVLVVSDFGSRLPSVWDDFELHRIPLDRARSLRFSYPLFWHRAAGIAAGIDAEVYHAHDLDALLPAARAAGKRKARLMYDSHELFVEQSSLVDRPRIRAFWRWLERRLIRRVDLVLTVSPAIAESLQETYNLPQRPVLVRNLPPFREPVGGEGLRQALGLVGDDEPLVLYQGGFLTGNGLPEQIAAMRQIGEGRLALLGSGPMEESLRRQVTAWGLEDRVRFLAPVPFSQLHAFTCGADLGLCVIKPTGNSFRWSMPNKLFEYLMAGLPVVAGDTPEIRRVIEETGTGALVDPEDPEAIAAAIRGLLKDEPLRRRMGEAARQSAEKYCWEREAPRLLEAYEQL